MLSNFTRKVLRLKLIFFISLLPSLAFAQEEEERLSLAGYKFLDYGSELPENLLSGKTAVIMRVDHEEPGNPARGDWRPIAQEAQRAFAEVGIDAVAYYYYDDLFSHPTITAFQSQQMVDRGISTVVVLSRINLEIRGKDATRFGMVITSFSGDQEIMNHGQAAWKQIDKDLEGLLKGLEKKVNRSRLDRQNQLINEEPEYFHLGGSLVTNKVYRDFPADVTSRKIGIMSFEPIPIPEDKPGGLANNELEKQIEEANRSRAQMNKTLEAAFANYPFEWAMLDYDPIEDPKQMRLDGYTYLLGVMLDTGHSIRHFMGYPEIEEDEKLVTAFTKNGQITQRYIPANAPVYKVYLQHVNTGNIYVGPRWDADESLADALDHFMENLKASVRR